jgi:hypothetical protein
MVDLFVTFVSPILSGMFVPGGMQQTSAKPAKNNTRSKTVEFKKRGVSSAKVITVYHGTTLVDLGTIQRSGIDPSKGHGEYGLGFYTVFSPKQALHIAQSYWDSEERYNKELGGIAVLAIDIPLETWETLLKGGTCYDFTLNVEGVTFPDKRVKWEDGLFAKTKDNRRENRGQTLIIGYIKAKKTPYLQAVFGTKAADLLAKCDQRPVYQKKLPAGKPIGEDRYASAEAAQEPGSFAAVPTGGEQLEAFKKGAETHKTAETRKAFVESIFGGFDDANLPDDGSTDGLALVAFLKDKGLKVSEKTSPGEAIFLFINQGF